MSEKDRRYREAHYHLIRARIKEHRVNRAMLLARKERYRIKNRESIREWDRDYRANYRLENRARDIEEKRLYRKKHIAKVRQRDRVALARKIKSETWDKIKKGKIK